MLYAPEPLKDFTLSFPPFVFYFIMLIGYELLILLLYVIGRAINNISDRNAQTLSVEP
jgi:hypothetical protein